MCAKKLLTYIRQEIEALNAEFAWLIDHQDGRGVSALFVEEGVYNMSNRVYRGRHAIDGFYDARQSRGQRAARHVFTNLHLKRQGETHATGTVILTLYACDGAPPYPTQAILVADYDDEYVLDADGRWRYRTRTIAPIFGCVPVLAPLAARHE
jgi:SnoaL-like domain